MIDDKKRTRLRKAAKEILRAALAISKTKDFDGVPPDMLETAQVQHALTIAFSAVPNAAISLDFSPQYFEQSVAGAIAKTMTTSCDALLKLSAMGAADAATVDEIVRHCLSIWLAAIAEIQTNAKTHGLTETLQ